MTAVTLTPLTTYFEDAPVLALPLVDTDVIGVVREGVLFRIPGIDVGGGTVTYAAPATGATLTAVSGQTAFVAVPIAGIATLTLILPPDIDDGAIFEFSTTQTIDALSITGASGQSISSGAEGPYVLGANGGVSWRYRLANTTWYPRS